MRAIAPCESHAIPSRCITCGLIDDPTVTTLDDLHHAFAILAHSYGKANRQTTRSVLKNIEGDCEFMSRTAKAMRAQMKGDKV
jgi:hypothetical protein